MATVSEKKKSGLYWIWLSILVVIIDQGTKYIITQYLPYNTSIYLLPVLNLTLEHNRGAAFSFLSQVSDYAVWLFIVTAVIVSLIICIWLHRLSFRNRWLGVSLSLILGGALGNLLDRIIYGYVVDFIHFHVTNWNWPIFNVADTAITIGAIMLIIDIFRKG